jgi:hypothetical protein
VMNVKKIAMDELELVREDASHLGMEMGHLWYKSYSLHSSCLGGALVNMAGPIRSVCTVKQ